MKFLSHWRPQGLQVRDMMRQKKWKRALFELEKLVQIEEQNYSVWNAIGDAHFQNGSPQEAVGAWRRAVEGFTLEGFHENALAISKKILRTVPGENNLHLMIAELNLALQYDADALISLGTYLRLCSRRSEPELRAFFRKILESHLHHPHLLEEILPLFRESGIEDQELQTELEAFVVSKKTGSDTDEFSQPTSIKEVLTDEETSLMESASGSFGGTQNGLLTLGTVEESTQPTQADVSASFASELTSEATLEEMSPVKTASGQTAGTDILHGEGRDHFDLGIVYQEMELWDAAIGEFEQARRDKSISARADLALAECVIAKGKPKQALKLLESFEQRENEPAEMQLRFELIKGNAHEALGNHTQALAHFETVYQKQESFGNVEEKIRALKKRMTDEDSDFQE